MPGQAVLILFPSRGTANVNLAQVRLDEVIHPSPDHPRLPPTAAAMLCLFLGIFLVFVRSMAGGVQGARG